MPETPDRPDTPGANPRAWLEDNFSRVSRIITVVTRRRRLAPQDAQELLSMAWSHLAHDDYRVLRRYRGGSSISTYLRVVVERLVLDMWITRWGKWRPSARARRLGRHAMLFERLVLRDGHGVERAKQILSHVTGADFPEALERAVLGTVPRRSRRFVSLDEAANRSTTAGDPLLELVDRFRARQGASVGRRLERALRTLSAENQVLIRMRHEQGLKVTEMATRLGVNHKPLYRRLAAIHADLRSALRQAGVCAGVAMDLTSGQAIHLPCVLRRLSPDPAGHDLPGAPTGSP